MILHNFLGNFAAFLAAGLFGASVVATRVAVQEIPPLNLAVLILFLGIFGGALGYFFWTFALTRLTPTQVAVYVNVNPMVATILGAALLAEKLTGVFIGGFVTVLVGVLFVYWPRRI